MQLGIDHQLTDNWNMQARLQRGSTRKYTAVLNELRVDRHFLGMDAVEVYRDRRDGADADTLPDLVADADRGTGDIICNVNRYNPTPAQLRAAVAEHSACRPCRATTRSGGPADLVPIPGPVGPGCDLELRAVQHPGPRQRLGRGGRLLGLDQVGRLAS